MSKKPDGGNAFPVDSKGRMGYDGMSLRDYFAGEALPCIAVLFGNAHKGTDSATLALMAYEIADAMIAARDK